jgi:hypothetical protein
MNQPDFILMKLFTLKYSGVRNGNIQKTYETIYLNDKENFN